MLLLFRFKGLCTQLKTLKTEIEHLQHLLENARLKLQNDFEKWWVNTSTVQSPSLQETVILYTVKTDKISPATPLLTGDARTDNDIIGFYKARHKLINK